MSLSAKLREDVIVIRPTVGSEDIYGEATEGVPTQTTYKGLVWQEQSRELLKDRDTVLTNWRFILPGHADVEAKDRISYQGQTFEVVGKPVANYRSQIGGPESITGDLLLVEDI